MSSSSEVLGRNWKGPIHILSNRPDFRRDYPESRRNLSRRKALERNVVQWFLGFKSHGTPSLPLTILKSRLDKVQVGHVRIVITISGHGHGLDINSHFLPCFRRDWWTARALCWRQFPDRDRVPRRALAIVEKKADISGAGGHDRWRIRHNAKEMILYQVTTRLPKEPVSCYGRVLTGPGNISECSMRDKSKWHGEECFCLLTNETALPCFLCQLFICSNIQCRIKHLLDRHFCKNYIPLNNDTRTPYDTVAEGASVSPPSSL